MGKRLVIEPGHLFGLLTVVRRVHRPDKKNRYLECSCVCGGSTVASVCHLTSGHTASCGCLQKKRASEATRTHGQSPGKGRKGTLEFNTWSSMKARCLNKNNPRYHQYGGRGIRICDEWTKSFEAFIAYVGKRPSAKHSIDRIDVNGHYEPGNVRWATMSEQLRNRRPFTKRWWRKPAELRQSK